MRALTFLFLASNFSVSSGAWPTWFPEAYTASLQAVQQGISGDQSGSSTEFDWKLIKQSLGLPPTTELFDNEPVKVVCSGLCRLVFDPKLVSDQLKRVAQYTDRVAASWRKSSIGGLLGYVTGFCGSFLERSWLAPSLGCAKKLPTYHSVFLFADRELGAVFYQLFEVLVAQKIQSAERERLVTTVILGHLPSGAGDGGEAKLSVYSPEDTVGPVPTAKERVLVFRTDARLEDFGENGTPSATRISQGAQALLSQWLMVMSQVLQNGEAWRSEQSQLPEYIELVSDPVATTTPASREEGPKKDCRRVGLIGGYGTLAGAYMAAQMVLGGHLKEKDQLYIYSDPRMPPIDDVKTIPPTYPGLYRRVFHHVDGALQFLAASERDLFLLGSNTLHGFVPGQMSWGMDMAARAVDKVVPMQFREFSRHSFVSLIDATAITLAQKFSERFQQKDLLVLLLATKTTAGTVFSWEKRIVDAILEARGDSSSSAATELINQNFARISLEAVIQNVKAGKLDQVVAQGLELVRAGTLAIKSEPPQVWRSSRHTTVVERLQGKPYFVAATGQDPRTLVPPKITKVLVLEGCTEIPLLSMDGELREEAGSLEKGKGFRTALSSALKEISEDVQVEFASTVDFALATDKFQGHSAAGTSE